MRFDAQVFMRVFGNELRLARKRRGWYRKDLLARLDHEVSEQTLATYELGTRNCTVVRFIEIANALGVSPLELLRQAFEQLYDTDLTGFEVDLVAAAQLERAELGPLQRWAQCRLSSHPSGKCLSVRFELVALRPLAELCKVNLTELIRAIRDCRPAKSRQPIMREPGSSLRIRQSLRSP